VEIHLNIFAEQTSRFNIERTWIRLHAKATIGFAHPVKSGSQQELKIIRFYLESHSLPKVVSVCPMQRTSTVQAKAIPGIVLSLRLVHSCGLFWAI
jgi:hypothetical protein